MSNHRIHWIRPELVVLTRATPQERVLTDCKRIGHTGLVDDATDTAQLGCDKGSNDNCGACLNRSTS